MEKLLTKDEILDVISKMSVLDLVEFIEAAEKRFKVSSSTITTAPLNDIINSNKSNSISSVKDDTKIEQTEFKLILKDFGADKIKVIKVIRSITKLGLKESKDLVESVPVLIKDKLEKDEAVGLKKELESAGATIILE